MSNTVAAFFALGVLTTLILYVVNLAENWTPEETRELQTLITILLLFFLLLLALIDNLTAWVSATLPQTTPQLNPWGHDHF